MQKFKINLAYVLSILSSVLYLLIPSYFGFSKTVEFVFAGVTVAIALAAFILFVVSSKKSNFNKEQLPFYVPSLVTMLAAVAFPTIKLIKSFSLGFVPVLGDGMYRYFGFILAAFSVYNAVAAVCINFMKTEE